MNTIMSVSFAHLHGKGAYLQCKGKVNYYDSKETPSSRCPYGIGDTGFTASFIIVKNGHLPYPKDTQHSAYLAQVNDTYIDKKRLNIQHKFKSRFTSIFRCDAHILAVDLS